MSDAAGSPVIEPGEIVGGKYKIGQMIGRGGMSVVYDAKHVQLRQDLAVKVLTGTQTLSRVLAEAQATARLTSEHIVRVVDVGTTKAGFGYVVMEKLRGCDLAEMLRGKKPLPVQEAVKLVLEACHGLAEAHGAGIVHRDIKPSNLFLAQKPDRTVTLKVLDFGLARAEVTAATTARGSARGPRIAGSPGYASPEQLGTASDADARADIWGLGIVLYESVSGHRPFEAANLQDALIAAATLPMPPLTSPAEPIPPGFEDVVRKCLEKDRENRYGSVQELAEALRSFAPPAFAHYVDRIRAVGKSPFSVATMRTVSPADGDHTATVGTFATDTFTAEASPDSLMPRSNAMPESVAGSTSTPAFVAASLVSPRLAVLLAAIAVVATCLVILIVLGTRKPDPTATANSAKPPPSTGALPSSTTALGPLPPLALPPLSGTAPPLPPPQSDPPPVVIHLDDVPAPTSGPTPKKKSPKPASSKPGGNPMTYR